MKPGSSLLTTTITLTRRPLRSNAHKTRNLLLLRYFQTSRCRYSAKGKEARAKTLKTATEMAATTVNKTAHAFDKTRLDALLNRRFFYAPAFEIYGGASLKIMFTPIVIDDVV